MWLFSLLHALHCVALTIQSYFPNLIASIPTGGSGCVPRSQVRIGLEKLYSTTLITKFKGACFYFQGSAPYLRQFLCSVKKLSVAVG